MFIDKAKLEAHILELTRQLSREEREAARQKELTDRQYALRKEFRDMFNDELYLEMYIGELSGQGRLRLAGKTLRQRMEAYPFVADHVITLWAQKFGLVPTEKDEEEEDEDESLRHVASPYETFVSILKTVQ